MYNAHLITRRTCAGKLIVYSFLLGLTLFLTTVSSRAQGNLLVFPKRIVFEDGKKSQVINLTNTGKDTAQYDISFVQIRMKDDGMFENISQPDEGQMFADTFIRFFPRTVRLAPNESQVVKVQLTKASELKPGEYRSHLYFRAEPSKNSALKNSNAKSDSTSLAVHITTVFGLTIPSIIRVGESNTEVSLSNLAFTRIHDSIPAIKMEFDRTGNMSVYGDITVNYISPSGKITRVGEVKGLAVYTPGNVRRCTIKLNQPKDVDYSSGKLSVTYSSEADEKSEMLVKAEVTL